MRALTSPQQNSLERGGTTSAPPIISHGKPLIRFVFPPAQASGSWGALPHIRQLR
jgi:hypothetical protein